MSQIRVVVVDDQELVRTGFAMILEKAGLAVVGLGADGAEGIALAGSLRPDVVLMDVRMPGIDGIEATRQITALDAPPRVLVLTTFDLDEHVRFPPDRRGIDNEDRDAREAEEVRPGVP